MGTTSRLLLFGWCLLAVVAVQAQPSIGGFKVYYGHLHNHTNVSDGTNTPDAAYNYARNTGKLDFFSISDHSNAIGAAEWASMKAAADKYNLPGVFTAFCGFEWTSGTLGHVTVIQSENIVTTASPTHTFAGLCNWLNNNECVAFFNHPGRNNSTGLEFDHFAGIPSDKLVGMELWNNKYRFPVYYYTDGYYPNDGNKSWFDEAIGRGWKIGASGSEDNHSGTWGTASPLKMAILAGANNRNELYAALKARRFFSTYDKNLGLSFKINGHEMGSLVTAGAMSFNILASDADGEVFSQVQLLKNGVVVQTWTPGVSGVSLSGNRTITDGEYYYIRVKQADSDEAISSPIWVGEVNNSPATVIHWPHQNSFYLAPAYFTLSASATDSDGSIQKVEFYQGSTLLGVDTSSPYSYPCSGIPAGSYQYTAKATDNRGGSTISKAIQVAVINPGVPVTSDTRIASGMDDIEEGSTGNLINNVNSTDIELVYNASTTSATQVVGLRFRSMNIPKGAIVSNAYIQFTCDEINSGACNLVISGEDVDNSATFTTTAFNVSSRAKTSAKVSWLPAGWSVVGESGIKQRTPNLAAIVQEIVSRPGYLSTSAISFIITGSGTRIAESYEGSAGQAARLVVQFSLGTGNKPPVVSIASPASGAVYSAPANIVLDVTATDADGSIAKVDFYNGPNLIASDSSSPYSFKWANVAEGVYSITAKATDDKGATTTSAAITASVNAAPVKEFFSRRIALGSDDVEETANGVLSLNSSDIELVYDTNSTGSQIVGLRFNGVSIPKNAVILKAYVQFTVDEKTTADCNLTIKGERSVNPTTFSTTAKVSARSKTLASVNWVPTGWATVGLAEASQQTPDLKAIVQEIVNQGAWASGNSLALIITGTGSGKRTAAAYEASPAKAALLYVEFQAPPMLKSGRTVSATTGNQVSLEPNGSIAELECYPVPFTDLLNVELKSVENDRITLIEIFNLSGALLKSVSPSEVKAQVQLPDLPSGIYIVRVKTFEKTFQRKITKK